MAAAKIDVVGSLYINRAGKMKIQLCRHAITGGAWGFSQVPCGDWCRSFGEPYKVAKGYYLPGCKGEEFFTELIDERLLMREFDKILGDKK